MTKPERINQEAVHRRAQVAVRSGLAAGDDVHDLLVILKAPVEREDGGGSERAFAVRLSAATGR